VCLFIVPKSRNSLRCVENNIFSLRMTYFSNSWQLFSASDSTRFQGCQIRFSEARFWNSRFFNALGIFWKSKAGFFLLFFSRKSWLWQNIVWAAHPLHTSSDDSRDLAGCEEYCKDFSVALKMFNLVDKKQMCDQWWV